jgi:hypothetical protein
LGGAEVAFDDGHLAEDAQALEPEDVQTGLEAAELGPGLRQARIEGVEAKQGCLRAGGEAALPAAKVSSAFLGPGALGAGERSAEQKPQNEPQPKREAALPTPTHGPGH